MSYIKQCPNCEKPLHDTDVVPIGEMMGLMLGNCKECGTTVVIGERNVRADKDNKSKARGSVRYAA